MNTRLPLGLHDDSIGLLLSLTSPRVQIGDLLLASQSKIETRGQGRERDQQFSGLDMSRPFIGLVNSC